MRLRGIEFAPIMNASGTRGFFGEGYWYHSHPAWRLAGLNFDRCGFVSKTTTFAANEGNMPLNPDFTPQEKYPDHPNHPITQNFNLTLVCVILLDAKTWRV